MTTRATAGDSVRSANFGELLRALRQQLDLSQGQLAQRVGLDRSYINRIEAGERGAPGADVILLIADALKLGAPDTDALLSAGRHPIRALVTLGLDDPTLLALARILTDETLEASARASLRTTIDTVIAHWGKSREAPAPAPVAKRARPSATTLPTAGNGGSR
ncbi:hypothetical protein LBMAG38_04720 [Chloroflexota bacterium]|nr:hypothetical protein LBMAG38_04720 [Chloroflexota bacterium]